MRYLVKKATKYQKNKSLQIVDLQAFSVFW